MKWVEWIVVDKMAAQSFVAREMTSLWFTSDESILDFFLMKTIQHRTQANYAQLRIGQTKTLEEFYEGMEKIPHRG